jgi:hypothetical protein
MTIKIRCQHNAAPTGLFCVSLSYHSYHNVAPMGLKLTPMPGGDLLAASIFRNIFAPLFRWFMLLSVYNKSLRRKSRQGQQKKEQPPTGIAL